MYISDSLWALLSVDIPAHTTVCLVVCECSPVACVCVFCACQIIEATPVNIAEMSLSSQSSPLHRTDSPGCRISLSSLALQTHIQKHTVVFIGIYSIQLSVDSLNSNVNVKAGMQQKQ